VTPDELFAAVQTDRLFRMPAIRLAEAHYRRHQATYMYLFDWLSPLFGGVLGACHALDLWFVFGILDANFSGWDEEARSLSRKMQYAWTSFARRGDPSGPGIGDWKQYDERRMTMVLGRQCALAEAPYDEERRAWEHLAGAIPDPSQN
jgi:para-nitrobenzyl esterase